MAVGQHHDPALGRVVSRPEFICPARRDFNRSLPLESIVRWRVAVSYAYSGWQRTQYELTELGELKEGTTELTAVGPPYWKCSPMIVILIFLQPAFQRSSS